MGYGVRSKPVVPTRAVAEWSMHRVVRPSAEPSYKRALAAFVAMVQGRAVAVPGLADGMRALEVVEAAERSAISGAVASVGSP